MVVHAYTPSTGEAEAVRSQFGVCLGYIVRFCLKEPKIMVTINRDK
jgi:hypothetical protein